MDNIMIYWNQQRKEHMIRPWAYLLLLTYIIGYINYNLLIPDFNDIYVNNQDFIYDLKIQDFIYDLKIGAMFNSITVICAIIIKHMHKFGI